jgi:hypothetical protein
MAQAIGTRNTSGDGSAVIAAPGAGLRIVIFNWRVQAEADGDQVVLLKSGSTSLKRFFMATKAQGIVEDLSGENETDKRVYCGANEAVFVNLSASLAMNYDIEYYVDGA